MTQDSLNLLTDIIARAKQRGAENADAVMYANESVSVSLRLGKTENIERSESKGFGLRVMIGKKQAIVSSTDTGEDTVNMLVERAVDMARIAPEDPYLAIASPEMLATTIPDLELYDPVEPSAEWLTESARRAEETALATPGITNSEGADSGYSKTTLALAISNGFAASYQSSSTSMSISVLAEKNGAMERDYDYSIARFTKDVTAPEALGKSAAERTLARLGPRRITTAQLPVVFDPRISKGLIGSFASAINGAAIARGTSFLKNHLGKQVFGAGVTIMDDPYRIKGLSSRPFDGEGIAGSKRAVLENGVLTTWLMDLRSANQLGLTTTGNAARGLSSPPSPSSTNLYMENGKVSPQELISDIKQGLYLTEVYGMGINLITGDYSQGASGMWIENGVITYPVSEITVAGNLLEMFASLTPANDLEFRYGTNAPTVRIERMTVAGV